MTSHRSIRFCGIMSAALLICSIPLLFVLDTKNASSQSSPTVTPTATAGKQPMEALVTWQGFLPLVASAAQGGMPYSYSTGDASGDLMVQAYTRFTAPSFTLDASGGANSCQQGNHILEAMWMRGESDQPLPLHGHPGGGYMEVGFAAGLNLADPRHWGCDIGYYYANYPTHLIFEPFDLQIPMGLGDGPHDYWIRFVNPTPGTLGMYVIIDGVEQLHYNNQWCCSNDVNVGLELHADPNAPEWSASITDDTPLAYYDLNWNVHNWSGCTAEGYPNNCSHQDQRMGGQWVDAWNDYRNWFPLR